ncbi:MAG: hypothetical protein V3T72_19530, partial [Thermoanaerobaculia bacterium]
DSPVYATTQIGTTYDFQTCAIAFPPNGPGFVDNCADDLNASAVVDVTTYLRLDDPDYNFGGLTTFTPPGASTAAGTSMPVGTIIGKLKSFSSLGLTGGPCGQANTPVPFIFMNGTIDNSDGNLTFPFSLSAAGGLGVLEPLMDDDDGDGLPNHVDLYPSYIKKILDPDRVGDINGDGDEFDTVSGVQENPGASMADLDGTVNSVVPLARYSGAIVAAGTAVVLEFIIIPPGGFSAFYAHAGQAGNNGMYPSPLADLADPDLGASSFTVLQDPTAPAAPSAIGDFCTALDSYTLLWGVSRDNPCTTNMATTCTTVGGSNSPIAIGADPGGAGSCSGSDEGGCTRYTNGTGSNGIGGTGTHLYRAASFTLRDLDGDGSENGVDTCPFNTNIDANFRNSTGPDSPAGDKLDSVCDPDPDGGGSQNANQDNDNQPGNVANAWVNANDNCPLDANNDQKETENTTQLFITAPFGGSRTDAIGDACDGVTSVGNPGALGTTNIADGHWHADWVVVAKCIGADGDADGWCDATETALGSNTASSASTPEHYNITTPLPILQRGAGGGMVGEPIQVCNDGIDNDDDGFTDELDVAGCWPNTISQTKGVDTDGDGWSDVSEDYLGTDPNNPCGVGNSPADLIAGTLTPNGIDIQDLTDYIVPNRYFNTDISDWPSGTGPGTDGGALTHDLSVGKGPFATDINILDLTVMVITGPPVLQGDRQFAQTCPFAP